MNYLQNYLLKKIILFFFCICTWNYAIAYCSFDVPQIISRADGSMEVLWESHEEDVFGIRSVRYDSISETWSKLTMVSDPKENASRPKLYINSLGNAVIGWLAINPNNGMYILKVATQFSGEAWESPITISSDIDDVQDFQLHISNCGTSGTVMAVWRSLDPKTNLESLWTATMPFGWKWSAPTQLIGNP